MNNEISSRAAALARRGKMKAVLSMAAAIALGAAVLVPFDPAVADGANGEPDFSGVYMPAGFGKRTPEEPPFRDEVKPIVEEYKKEFTADDDPGRFCVPPGMPRAIWGAPFAIEVFQRPQDLTFYFEGYSIYRKVYMRDQNPPKPLLDTGMGYSVAHWDGDVLVIETDHLKPYPYMDDLPTTENARVVERLSLEHREDENGEMQQYMVDEITLTDPALYTQPIKIHVEAVLTPDGQVLEYTCGDQLWEKHLQETGLEVPDLSPFTE